MSGAEERQAEDYALASKPAASVPAPDLSYRPPTPRRCAPGIALFGAGAISAAHLDAYRQAGYGVRVIGSRTLAKAAARRDEFFPEAEVSDDFDAVARRRDIEIIDITTHPAERVALIEAALNAGKHVLSQKPFVLDLSTGERLCELAERLRLKLAVNQNGRWAPHLAYMREATRAGIIGDLASCDMSVHWNHQWIKGTPFEKIDDLILYDFAIHWFDFLTSLIGARATEVFAMRGRAAGQEVAPPLLARILVAFEGGQASLAFNAATRFGAEDCTFIAGAIGSLSSIGPDLGQQTVRLATEAGVAAPRLEGSWFNDGFRGAMGELLCAIEDDREPLNGARENLNALALAFAAIASANSGLVVRPGAVRSLDAARAGSGG